jgi:hypothetical protein
MQFSKCNIIFTLSQECFLILLQQAPSVISWYFGFLWLKPRPDFSGNSGGAGENFKGGSAVYLTAPMECLSLESPS